MPLPVAAVQRHHLDVTCSLQTATTLAACRSPRPLSSESPRSDRQIARLVLRLANNAASLTGTTGRTLSSIDGMLHWSFETEAAIDSMWAVQPGLPVGVPGFSCFDRWSPLQPVCPCIAGLRNAGTADLDLGRSDGNKRIVPRNRLGVVAVNVHRIEPVDPRIRWPDNRELIRLAMAGRD